MPDSARPTAAAPRGGRIVYSLSDEGLAAEPGASLPLADIVEVRTYDIPMWKFAGLVMAGQRRRCIVRPRRGRSMLIGGEDALRLSGGDADAPYDAFVKSLRRRVAQANPKAVIAQGMPALLWWVWMVLLLGCLIVAALAISVLATNITTGRIASSETVGALVFLLALIVLIVPVARLLPYSRPQPIDRREL